MADEIPVIPKVESILVNTGNIVNWNRLQKRLTQSPTEELVECLTSTVETWLKTADKDSLQYEHSLECHTPKRADKITVDIREEYKITVKIFLNELDPKLLEEAVDKVLSELSTPYLDTVLLSVPRDCRQLEDLVRVWPVLVKYAQSDRVLNLGVCDLDVEQLTKIDESPEITLKPDIVQVNLSNCCHVPTELQEFAKEHEMQLLTHNDPLDILPPKDLQDSLAKVFTTRDSEIWEPAWIARYGVMIRCRGIIKTKGYMSRLQRDMKQRKPVTE